MARQVEYALHCAVADYLRAVLPPDVLWSTIGHGGGGKIRGAKLKRAGLRPGIADLIIGWRDLCRAYVLWIELKTKRGRQSPEQWSFEHLAASVGQMYHIAHSVQEVESLLQSYGVPTRGKIAA